jgi:ATP-binding cassette subfamily B protein RaxB
MMRKKINVILQSEQADCGHACLCMISGYWGKELTLEELKFAYSTSVRGINLLTLKNIATEIGFSSTAIKCSTKELTIQKQPTIIHWNKNHYVIFEAHHKGSFYIIDPVSGRRKIPQQEFEKQFNGICLIMTPDADLVKKKKKNEDHVKKIIIPIFMSSMPYILIISLLLEVINIAIPFSYGWLIDKVIKEKSSSVITGYVFLSSLLIILTIIASVIKNKILLVKGSEFYLTMQEELQKKIFNLPLSFYEKKNAGEIAARLNSINYIRRTFSTESSNIITNALLSVISLVTLFFINHFLPLITVAILAVFILVRMIFYKHQMYAKNSEYAKAPILYSIVQESITAMASIKMAQSEKNRYRRWLDKSFDAECDKHTYDKYALLLNDLKTSLNNADQFITVFVIFAFLWGNGLTIGNVFTYLFIRSFFFTRTVDFILKTTEIRLMSVYSDRINEILCMSDERRGNIAIKSNDTGFHLVISKLSFQYSQHEKSIFENLDLEIKAGESVAITGDSGTGKTTLAKLLAGFYDRYEGEIYIENIELKEIDIKTYRKNIATVFQNDRLLSGSLIENISSFEKHPDIERVIECCAMANINRKIEKLAMKYETWYHSGSDSFSGGELQRLLIARALYKKPNLLIMDESTSHLDIKNESVISENIKALKMTRVIIAHRSETILSADRIIRLGR